MCEQELRDAIETVLRERAKRGFLETEQNALLLAARLLHRVALDSATLELFYKNEVTFEGDEEMVVRLVSKQ